MSDQGTLPVLASQNGNIFSDRDDPDVCWYLPALQPADPTAAFAFAATVGPQVNRAGNPFDSATLAIPLTVADPPDVVAARQANPGVVYQVIPASACDVTLTVPYTGDDGTAQTSSVSGTVAAQPDGTLLAVFAGLLGPAVVQEYLALTSVGGSVLTVGWSFTGWAHLLRPFLLNPGTQPGTLAEPAMLPLLPVRSPLPVMPAPPVRPPLLPPVPAQLWVTVTTRQALTVPLGLTYAQQPYRPLYTLAEPPAAARPIVTAADLTGFAAAGTQYVQLSSLGDVPTRYPSLSAVYLGQVSGTVVAVPAAYGIVHTSSGCAMAINAVVDPDSVSGSQFQVSLTLAAMIDPCDLAQLAADVPGIPEATGRTLTVVPPAGLASGSTPSFSISGTVTSLVIADGQAPGTVDVSFVVADFQSGGTVIPAWATINELILQLTSGLTPPPLFGSISLRLDDAYPQPPQASFFLALTATAAAADTAVTTGPGQSNSALVTVTNQSPNDLLLLRLGLATASGQVDQALGQQVLPAGQATSVIVVSQPPPSAAVVSTALAVPAPFPRGLLQSYLTVTAEPVQQIGHQLTVNATAIDFTALGLASVTVQVTLTALPAVTVPPLPLTAASPVATTTVVVPLGSALVGLSATVRLAVTQLDGSAGGTGSLTTDFMTDPILVLTPDDLPGGS